MALIESTIAEMTVNIKDTQSQNGLQAVENTNKRLRQDKLTIFCNVDCAKADMDQYEESLAMVSRNLKVATRAVKKIKTTKPPLDQALREHLHGLAVYQGVLDNSTLAVNAITCQLEAIVAQEILVYMFEAILKNQTLGDLASNGWVHKEGGSMQSGFNHAVQIIRACLKFNTSMPTLNFATMLGVKVDNHRVKAALVSLVGGNVLSVSTNKLNQEVYSFTPAIKLFLHHEILPTSLSYIEKIAQGNKCITNRAAALQANRLKAGYQYGDTDLDNDSVGNAYEVNSGDDLDLATV